MEKIILGTMILGLAGAMAVQAATEDTVAVSATINAGVSSVALGVDTVDFGGAITPTAGDIYQISQNLDMTMFAANGPWNVRIGTANVSGEVGLESATGDLIGLKYWRPDFGPDPVEYTTAPDPDDNLDWWWVPSGQSPETICWRWLSDINTGDGGIADFVAWHKDSVNNPQSLPGSGVDPADYESVKGGAVRIAFAADELVAATYSGTLKVEFNIE